MHSSGSSYPLAARSSLSCLLVTVSVIHSSVSNSSNSTSASFCPAVLSGASKAITTPSCFFISPSESNFAGVIVILCNVASICDYVLLLGRN